MLNRKSIETDLCVVGGGIAGICTAISAARNGIDVVLMHERPVLGGNASSEIRMWICGAQGDNMRETGIMEEIMLKNFYYNPTKNPYIFDNVLMDMVRDEKNITLLLNCTCMDAVVENGDYEYERNVKIKSVTGYQMTTQTFIDVNAKLYADCSGDSILAPLTGAEFRIGRESNSEYGETTHVKEADLLTMGNSCLLQARQTEKKVPFVAPSRATKLTSDNFKDRNPDLYNEYENFWYLELGGNRDTINESEEISEELSNLAYGTWSYIKNNPEYKADNFELEFVGALPGKRESRRYVGEYIMKQQDISNATRFKDTVAYGGWPIDDHFPEGFYHKGVPNTDLKTSVPYPIPYRILYSKNVANLFFAGRNVSATHTALSSIRVMATCGVMGQAVGTAAAIAIKNNLSPQGVYEGRLGELQTNLLDADCFLPYMTREISTECIAAELNIGGKTIRNGEDRVNQIYDNRDCGVRVKNGQSIDYVLNEATNVKSIHIVFNSDLNRDTMPGGEAERIHATRCNIMLDSPIFYMPKTLCKDFEVSVMYGDNTIDKKVINDNMKRAYHFEIDKKVKKISLTPLSNWGDTDLTDVFSFDFQ